MRSREFNHRVKGVTMSLWTEKEVEALKKGGNRVGLAAQEAQPAHGGSP